MAKNLAGITNNALSVLGALVFYFLALLITVIFDDCLKSLAFYIVVYPAMLYSLRFIESSPRWHIHRLIAGEDYFLYGQIPWPAVIVSLPVSVLLLFITIRIFERRDF